jgi:16S rRNA (guanine527-N7)-methyltransferase
MEPDRLRALLAPFVTGLTGAQLQQLGDYLGLLLKWNRRINLTAVRSEEEIVTRHFGESLFAAEHLLETRNSKLETAFDLGSGAGFPGLPLKIYAPTMHVTLIESRQKKAAFLREVIRVLELPGIDVFAGRAESLTRTAGLVTLRAVERFAEALPAAACLLAPGGRLALLIGASQADAARRLLPALTWQEPVAIPHSRSRTLLVGTLPA